MFEIDKAKFGASVAQLRKEKGLMLNNSNWPNIAGAGQLWAMIGLVASPVIVYFMTNFLPEACANKRDWI